MHTPSESCLLLVKETSADLGWDSPKPIRPLSLPARILAQADFIVKTQLWITSSGSFPTSFCLRYWLFHCAVAGLGINGVSVRVPARLYFSLLIHTSMLALVASSVYTVDMGDRFIIDGLPCAYCRIPQEEVCLAESSGFIEHQCDTCGKINRICSGHHLTKMTLEEHAKEMSDFSGEPYASVLGKLDRKKYE